MHLKLGTIALATCAFLLGGALGAFAWLGRDTLPVSRNTPLSKQPAWTEIAWPFGLDEWGTGKAFRCVAAQCGAATHLYIRAKIGFCNCTTGVADDAELERLSDFTLMGDRIANLGDGRPIKVAWRTGRSRSYSIGKPIRSGQSALSVAFNDQCDAVVATVVVDKGDPAAVERSALEFLNSTTVVGWAKVALGQ
jgi:hypothetical protein